MPWQSLIQIQSFFEPPPAAPQQDDAAEFSAAQQFGNVVTWSLAAVMALSFFVEPPTAAAEEPPPTEPETIGSSHLIQVGKFYSGISIPSHTFDPPWPPPSDVVPPEVTALAGGNLVDAGLFYQTVLVPGASYDPPFPPLVEVVDESPLIEASKQFIGFDLPSLRGAADLGFIVDAPLDVGVEWLVTESAEPDSLPRRGRTPGTLAEPPVEPNLPVVPVDDPLLALVTTQMGAMPLIPAVRIPGTLAEAPIEPNLPVVVPDDPTLVVSTAQVGNLPFPVVPAQPRGTLAEPPFYETLPPAIPPETQVAGAQLVQVGKFYSVIAAPRGSFDPPWDTSAGVVPFDPALLPGVMVGLPGLRISIPAGGFVLESPIYPNLPVIPVVPAAGSPALGIQEVGGAQLHIDEIRSQITIEERPRSRLEIKRWED